MLYLRHPKKELGARYLSNWSGRNCVFCSPFVTKSRTWPTRDKEITNSTSENGPNVLVSAVLKLDFILDISRMIFYSGKKKNDNFSRSERLAKSTENKQLHFFLAQTREKRNTKKICTRANTSLVELETGGKS